MESGYFNVYNALNQRNDVDAILMLVTTFMSMKKEDTIQTQMSNEILSQQMKLLAYRITGCDIPLIT